MWTVKGLMWEVKGLIYARDHSSRSRISKWVTVSFLLTNPNNTLFWKLALYELTVKKKGVGEH